MIGYKVLNNYMKSASFFIPEKYKVQYELNEWVGPNVENTRLFFFKNYKDAVNFKRKSLFWSVYKCEVKNPGRVKILSNFDNFDKFWKLKRLKKRILECLKYTETPNGTYSASEIKILKKM